LQAAEHAAASGAARLVLTHITPNLDPGVSLEQAAVGYEGSIDVAVPDMVIEVGA
jgi:ribonuclease BN (tRNA processing enzyme)